MTSETSFDNSDFETTATARDIARLRKSNGRLSRMLNSPVTDFLAGAAVTGGLSFATRAGVMAAAGAVGISSLPAALAAGAATGAVVGLYRFHKEYFKVTRIEAKGGLPTYDAFGKDYFRDLSRQLLKSTALSTVGGGLSYGFVYAYGDKIADAASHYAPKIAEAVKALDIPGKVSEVFRTIGVLSKDAWRATRALIPDNLGDTASALKTATVPPSAPDVTETPVTAPTAPPVQREIVQDVDISARIAPVDAPVDVPAARPQSEAARLLFNGHSDAPQVFSKDAPILASDKFTLAAQPEAPAPVQPEIPAPVKPLPQPLADLLPPAPVNATPVPEGALDALPSANHAAIAPAEIPAMQTMSDKIRAAADGRTLSKAGKRVLAAALDGDAQGLKDLGHALANGRYGFAKDLGTAVEFTKAAADADPTGVAGKGARVNLAFWKYHGQGGFDANGSEAIGELKALGKFAPARAMLAEWTGDKVEAVRTAGAKAGRKIATTAAKVTATTEKFDLSAAKKLGCVFKMSADGTPYGGVCKVSRKVFDSIKVGDTLNFSRR